MKRYCVEYNGKGVVTRISQGNGDLGGSESWCGEVREGANRVYCDAIAELGALARFMEAWEKYNETLLR